MPKPPSNPSQAALEIAIPGEPSKKMLARLKEAGAVVELSRIADAVSRVESARADWLTSAIETGLLLLAKKQALKHGQFQKFSAQVWDHIQNGGNGSKGKRVSNLEGPELSAFTRTLRHYAFLAQHFLADLEQSNFQPDWRDQQVIGPAIAADEVLALDTLPGDRQLAVRETIRSFVAGRSLRRMLTDLRRAEVPADAEQAEATREKGRDSDMPPADGSALAAADEAPPPVDLQGEQLELWREIAPGLHTLNTTINDDAFATHTTKEFWRALELSVASQLEGIRRRIKSIA